MPVDVVALEAVFGLLVVALASYRLTRVVTADSLTDSFRAYLWRQAYAESSYDSQHDRMVVQPRHGDRFGSRGWWWIKLHDLLTCPFCWGVWQTAVVWWAWTCWPWPIIRSLVTMTAAMGLQALLSSRKDA